MIYYTINNKKSRSQILSTTPGQAHPARLTPMISLSLPDNPAGGPAQTREQRKQSQGV